MFQTLKCMVRLGRVRHSTNVPPELQCDKHITYFDIILPTLTNSQLKPTCRLKAAGSCEVG